MSDSKLDMLASQIPPSLRERIAAELKIDLRLVAVSLGERPTQETRASKIRLIERYLDEHSPPGTPVEPAAWFRAKLPMKWGPYGGYQMVYFGGFVERTVVGLGGSLHHVIGTPGDSVARTTPPGFSSVSFGITRVLEEELGLETEPDDAFEGEDRWPRDVYEATRSLRGATQPLEFLAKRLLYGSLPSGSGFALLGTPLYVALADDEPAASPEKVRRRRRS